MKRVACVNADVEKDSALILYVVIQFHGGSLPQLDGKQMAKRRTCIVATPLLSPKCKFTLISNSTPLVKILLHKRLFLLFTVNESDY